MHRYILILGSNLGDRGAYLETSQKLLQAAGLTVEKETQVLETEAILIKRQPTFLNQGVMVSTEHEPLSLLRITQETERRVGRKERHRNGPREIDIDIAWWSGGLFRGEGLNIPHPYNNARYWVRQFVSELISAANEGTGHIMEILPIKRPQDWARKKQAGEKISMLTCYDYTMARLLARTSVDSVMVGDSLGNVIQGHDSTLPVTLEDIIYHSKCVRRGLPDTFLVSDLPFMTYQVSPQQAVASSGQLIKDAGCDAVKLEGALPEQVEQIVKVGIPVMGHLGLTPQSVRAMGGYKVQAKNDSDKKRLLQNAKELESAGAFALVLELVPGDIAEKVSKELSIPTIGIGAGAGTDGQVLVLQDMLGLNADFQPKFVRNYDTLAGRVTEAVERYAVEVRKKEFPSADETFS